MKRREFIGIGAAAALGLRGESARRIVIQPAGEESFRQKLAARELERGLSRLQPGVEIRPGGEPAAGDLAIALRVDAAAFQNPEAYSISAEPGKAILTGASEQALLYAVFDFLERQGAFLGIDGDVYPIDAPRELALPPAGQPWMASPRFAARGLLPWPDFLNCITVFNDEDFRAYFEAMLRMRFNTFGMHVYSSAATTESYLSFEYAGVGHNAYLDNSASARWGYLPQRTSKYGMGGGNFYDGEVFGSDATRLARGPWEAAERTREMLRKAFAYAAKLGIRTGIGFEPYQVPPEIIRALPPEAKPPAPAPGTARPPGPAFLLDSVAGRDLLETRLAQLLEAYPDVDYVWLWEDEQMNWASRQRAAAGKQQPPALSVTPFVQAHAFLKRHAPKKRLVLSGWGGVVRNFELFHQKLPKDIIFACLSDSLGWDPVSEVFAKLEGRERWPIPWLEDDPAMWLPQFHANRFENDMNLAAKFGCQGLLGIHWRHRIVDPTAGFQARFSWNDQLKAADYYKAWARTQAAGDRAERLAALIDDAEKNHKLLSTFTGEVKDGHAVTRAWSGDYNEAFTYWQNYEPEAKVMETQKEAAEALRALAAAAASEVEKERLNYLAGHVAMLVPYAEAWVLAHRLHLVLRAAAQLRAENRADKARDKVRTEGIPRWEQLAAAVRKTMLEFQNIVATRNDLGTLASMHNKFVRLALVRLRLSMREYLNQLPPEIEKLYAEVMQPDPQAPARIFIPTRPTMVAKGETAWVSIVVTSDAKEVTLRTRGLGAQWEGTPAKLAGRRTWVAALGPFAEEQVVEYSAAAGGLATQAYLLTVV